MQAIHRRDTRPELALRRALFRLGLRYRVDARPLPDLNRRADVVFGGKTKVAVFVHGCFWHRCPIHYKPPQTNAAYWTAKINRNVERDAQTAEALTTAGWLVEVVWEHEDLELAATRIQQSVTARMSLGGQRA